jgi:hypothetical protein
MLYMRWNEKARELEGEMMQPRNDAGRGERWADASCAAQPRIESSATPCHRTEYIYR